MQPKLRLFLIVAVLLVGVKADEESEDEEAVLASLKECSEKVKPSEDDLTEISNGELKSDTSKEVITCWFKGAEVMQDKKFQKEKAVVFLRALTPGDPKNDNVELMKKLTEKCASKVNSQDKGGASDTDAAIMIYNCMVQEGRAMKLSLEEGNKESNATAPV